MAPHALRILALFVLAGQGLVGPGAPDSDTRNGDSSTSWVEVTRDTGGKQLDTQPRLSDDHTGADRELIDWAAGRFEQIGLELPQVEIVIDADHERCDGAHGRFLGNDERSQIILCLEHTESFGAELHRRRTLVHELAHAWDHHRITDSERVRLVQVLGVDTWYGTDAEWDHRGAERFAETLVWGLYDQRRRPVLIDVSCADLHRDFVSLTGHRALGPIERVCELPATRAGCPQHIAPVLPVAGCTPLAR